MIPYFVLSIVALLPKYVLQPYLNDSLTLDGYSIARAFFAPRENIWGHFWFLPMIFIQGVCGFVLDKIFMKYKIQKFGWSCVMLATFAIYVTFYKQDISHWLSVNDLITFSWLFAFGCLCGNLHIIDKMTRHKSLFVVILPFLLSILLFIVRTPYIIAPFKYAFIAVLMIYALVELCIILSDTLNLNRDALYAQTFVIFLLSWPCQAVANVLVERLLHYPFYLIMPIQFIAGIVGPMFLIYIITKIETKYNIHWISFILGK